MGRHLEHDMLYPLLILLVAPLHLTRVALTLVTRKLRATASMSMNRLQKKYFLRVEGEGKVFLYRVVFREFSCTKPAIRKAPTS
jgi:hypothetical protein